MGMYNFTINDLYSQISDRMRIKFRVSAGDEDVEPLFYMVSLNEEKRYGDRSIILKDEDGRDVMEGYLADNSQVFPKRMEWVDASGDQPKTKSIGGGIKYVPMDETLNYTERSQVIQVDKEGNELPRYKSSLYNSRNTEPVPLEEDISIDEALDIDVNTVYVLFPADDATPGDIQGMKDRMEHLERLEIPRFLYSRFNFRESYNQHDGFLQLNQGNVMMLVGTRKEVKFYGHEVEIEELTDEDIDEMEMDFGF